MIVDDITYALHTKNYIPIDCIKKQIILANTFNNNMNHIIGWKTRMNGEYKKTAPFTIAIDGTIFKHYDPICTSKFFGDKEIDKQTIVILLENDGWLLRDMEKNLFITWVGGIYNELTPIVEKRWRGYNYWSSYSKKQLESAVELVTHLCNEFSIPMNVIGHNTKIDDIITYEGVLYKSNFEKHYNDLNPTWDFTNFKNKLENLNK